MTMLAKGLPAKYRLAGQQPIDMSKWFHFGLVWNGDIDEDGYAKVYYELALKLPSWGYFHDYCSDGYRWGQRAIYWHGKKGFRAVHIFN